MAIKVEPLSSRHSASVARFSCGVRRIDAYLGQGLTLQAHDLARLFVAIDALERNEIRGFYALHTSHIEARRMPASLSSTLRQDAVVGAVYIAMFAVDRHHQRRGIGTDLFRGALARIKRVSEEAGVWAVVLDALNEDGERFHRRFGFETLVGGTRRLYLPVREIG